MKTPRPLFAGVLSLVVAGGVMWADRPARAVVSVASSTTTTISYSGTVDGSPESVYLSGLVQIAIKVLRDPDFGQPPIVLLNIDLSNVSGVGQTTGTKYVTSGAQNLVRPLVATDVVEITFPFFPSGPGGAALARPALASFTLNFDTASGTFVGGTASTSVDVTDSLASAP